MIRSCLATPSGEAEAEKEEEKRPARGGISTPSRAQALRVEALAQEGERKSTGRRWRNEEEKNSRKRQK